MSSIVKFVNFNITSDVRVEDGEVWLTQAQLAELFQVDRTAIVHNIQKLEQEEEIDLNTVCKSYSLIAESSFSGHRDIKHYNIDVVYQLGYMTRNSDVARRFRKAATETLKALARDGMVVDKEVLAHKKDAIEIAIEALKDIRADERSAMEKLNAFFKSSVIEVSDNTGYNGDFYSFVQNKLHYATHEHTASDLIASRADHTKKDMGLTTYKGRNITKSDVVVAKNYLTEEEIKVMNRLVNIVLDSALDFLSRKMKKPASFWYNFIDDLLVVLKRPVLKGYKGSGKHTREEADVIAKRELVKYRQSLDAQLKFNELTDHL